MTLILIILLIVLLLGGGYGWNQGIVGPNPVGLILLIVIILVLVGALGGPRFGWW